MIVGIDPGQKGGVAVLRDPETILHVEPMPILAKEVQTGALYALLDAYAPHTAVIERQSIMGGQRGAMAIGSNFGRILAAVEIARVPYTLVTPTVWNRRAGIPPKLTGRAKKEASFEAAQRTWGSAFDRLGLRPTQDGLVEALLIARFGLDT